MKRKIITQETASGRRILQTVAAPRAPLEDYRIVAQDLMDTAKACRNPTAAGLAANQIGSNLSVVVVKFRRIYIPIAEPRIITNSEQTVQSAEGCLSRPSSQPITSTRYKWVKIEYLCPMTGVIKQRKFKKFDALVIQHEMDHLKGILI